MPEKEIVLAQPRRALDGSNPLDAVLGDVELLRTFPVENLERLVALQRQIREDDARQSYNLAFRDCQSELEPVVKDAWNDHTKSWYAKVSTIMASVDSTAQRHGFSRSISTKPSHVQGWLCFVLTMRHVDGHTEEHTFDAPPDGTGAKGGGVMNPVQGAKSSYTYAEGALLQKVWGIQVVEQDDDGNAGGGTAVRKITPKKAEKLRELMLNADADAVKFLRFFKIETVSDLPAAMFNEAVDMLQAKMAQNQAAAAAPPPTADATDVESEEVTDEPAPDADTRPVGKAFAITENEDGKVYGARLNLVQTGGVVVPAETEIMVTGNAGGRWWPVIVAGTHVEPDARGDYQVVTMPRPKRPKGAQA